MQRDRIQFLPGQPVTFKLNGRPPQPKTGFQGGTEWQYIVNDDTAIMWLPVEAHQAIQATGARNGDSITLTKPARRGGQWDASPARGAAREIPQSNTYSDANQDAPSAGSMAESYLCEAIDACVAASKYALAKHQLQLTWDADQIRRLAITLMINSSKEDY